MKTHYRMLSVIVSMVIVVVLAGPLPQAEADVNESFDGYGTGTLAEALSIAGVTFDGGGNYVIRPYTFASPPFVSLTGQVLTGGGPLTMSFSTPQQSFSFLFALDTLVSDSLSVQGTLGGTLVFNESFNATPPGAGNFAEGVATKSDVAFDKLVVTYSDAIAIDNLQTASEPLPGCDVTITIPSGAVGATITADTPVYWAPGQMSDETFPAGLNVRALGVDESGMYTKVLYVCGYYWVPTSVIGPNYDSPWNGAPLPTGVVG